MSRALLRSSQRGAALLLAMLIVTLVATLTAGMVWQQWQAIEVEGAERARSQATWLVQGAVDWARLILRTDQQDTKHPIDSLDEVWATPLQDVRLSEFLAADRDNTADSSGLDAFLTGRITDAQSRYNLRNLVQDEKEDADRHLQLMQRLCDILGLPHEVATRIADGMNGASLAEDQIDDSERVTPGSPLTPMRMEQLAWLGLDSETIRRLEPYVVILPSISKINLNTAPPEVLMAAVEGLDRATAERLLRARLVGGLPSLAEAKKLLPERIKLLDSLLDVKSQYFEVLGELRYDSFVVRERSLVMRRGQDVVVVRREALPPE